MKKNRSVSRPHGRARPERDVVAERLVHLAAAHAEHPVVHPDARELVPERAGLRELVLVMREDEVEPAPVDLEHRPRYFSLIAEHSMCQPRPPRPHGESQDVSSPGLFALPEREVARVSLDRVRLLLLDHVRAAVPRAVP
jgi:hypothetical protein